MKNCICDGVYGGGVWTAGIQDDFDYRNNVIMNGNYVWTYQDRRWPFPETDCVTGNRVPGFPDIDAAIFERPTRIYEHR